MESPQIGPLGALGGECYGSRQICGQMKVMTQTDEGSTRDRTGEREQCRKKKDDSVDKMKLEIKPTDGGAKNVTCQVASGTPGPDRCIRTVGRWKERESGNDRCTAGKSRGRGGGRDSEMRRRNENKGENEQEMSGQANGALWNPNRKKRSEEKTCNDSVKWSEEVHEEQAAKWTREAWAEERKGKATVCFPLIQLWNNGRLSVCQHLKVLREWGGRGDTAPASMSHCPHWDKSHLVSY